VGGDVDEVVDVDVDGGDVDEVVDVDVVGGDVDVVGGDVDEVGGDVDVVGGDDDEIGGNVDVVGADVDEVIDIDVVGGDVDEVVDVDVDGADVDEVVDVDVVGGDVDEVVDVDVVGGDVDEVVGILSKAWLELPSWVDEVNNSNCSEEEMLGIEEEVDNESILVDVVLGWVVETFSFKLYFPLKYSNSVDELDKLSVIVVDWYFVLASDGSFNLVGVGEVLWFADSWPWDEEGLELEELSLALVVEEFSLIFSNLSVELVKFSKGMEDWKLKGISWRAFIVVELDEEFPLEDSWSTGADEFKE